jgi:hypothetical protein
MKGVLGWASKREKKNENENENENECKKNPADEGGIKIKKNEHYFFLA